MSDFTNDYLLDKKIKIFQPTNGYRASSDAVLVSSLVESLKPSDTILDVGSGTGAISLCLAHRFPQHQIAGLELQPQLAECANLSAQENDFKNLTFYNHDIKTKKTPVAPCSFAHVVSNPPYSDHDMPSPNPSKALAHNHQNFDLSGWLHFCLKMLKPFGHIYLINRTEALNEILMSLSGKAGNIQIIPLYSKPKQSAKRIMIIAQKDSKAPTQILSPFYVHQDNGEYTLAAQQVLREGKSFSAVDI